MLQIILNGKSKHYIQGDYIEIQGCYINTNQELSEVVAEFREVVNQLNNKGYSAEKAEMQVAQDLEEKARSNPKVKQRLFKWRKSLSNTYTGINNEANAAREVIKYAAASQYTSSTKSISVVGGIYAKLDSLLQARKWKEADEETEKMIFKLLGKEKIERPSQPAEQSAYFAFFDNCLSGNDVEVLPGTELRNINKLWVEHSKGRFGFSVQKEIWESIVRNDPDDYGIFYGQGYQDFDERVGWYVKDDWIYYSDIKYSLTAPPGHLPIKVMLDKISKKCDCDQSIFRVFMKRQY